MTIELPRRLTLHPVPTLTHVVPEQAEGDRQGAKEYELRRHAARLEPEVKLEASRREAEERGDSGSARGRRWVGHAGC